MIYLINKFTLYMRPREEISPIDIDIINVCSAQAVEEDEQTNDAGKDQHLEGYNV